MAIFAEHDWAYWFERAMLLAARRTKGLDVKASGDASVTALAANFLEIATTVILDRLGIENGACRVFGAQKGNLSFDKLASAENSIAEMLRQRKIPENQVQEIVRATQGAGDSKGGRAGLVKAVAQILSFELGPAEALVKDIYKVAHPARIALEAGCAKWQRTFAESEYLVDFAVLKNSRMLLAMESEGCHVSSELKSFADLQAGSIYWDFFKLLNVDAEFKFLVVVERTNAERDYIRPGLKVMLDEYFEGASPRTSGQLWIFVFHPDEPHPDAADLPGFDMYEAETDPGERVNLRATGIESFLQP